MNSPWGAWRSLSNVGLFASGIRRPSGVAVGQHQAIVRGLVGRLEPHHLFQQSDGFRILFGIHARLGERLQRLREVRIEGGGALEMPHGFGGCWPSADLSDFIFRHRVAGIQLQFRFEFAPRQRQILRRMRFEQQRAPQAEVQVQSRRILFDGLAILRGRFRVRP